MSKFLYTVIRPFTFRGIKFKVGEPFDASAVQCDSHRAHTLMSQRYIEPGYDGEEKPKAVKQAHTPEKMKNEPQKPKEQPDEPDTNEADDTEESDEVEEEHKVYTPRRRSKRPE